MPSVSKAQRRAAAVAEHDPKQLLPENKGLAKMSESQLHDFAATKEQGLPAKVKTHVRKEVKRGYQSDKKFQHDTGRHTGARGKSSR